MTEHDIKRIDFELYKFRSNMEGSSDLEIFKDITKQWKEKPLPKGARTIAEWAEKGCTDKNFIEVVQYLADRKLLYPNDFYWTPNDKMYVQRAIMPFIYDGKIVGHTGRLVRDAKKFKYMADTPKEFIAGLDAQQEHDKKYVILCEGIFDAYVTDGIAALGNELNAHQISIINRLNKEVIVVPDRDEAGQNLFDIALREGWSISTPEWGKGIKDPAQAAEKYGRILTIQSIIKSSNKNAFTAKVKRKMDKA